MPLVLSNVIHFEYSLISSEQFIPDDTLWLCDFVRTFWFGWVLSILCGLVLTKSTTLISATDSEIKSRHNKDKEMKIMTER